MQCHVGTFIGHLCILKRAKAGAEQPCVLSVITSLKVKDNSMQLLGEVQFLPRMHHKLFGSQTPDPLAELTTLSQTL